MRLYSRDLYILIKDKTSLRGIEFKFKSEHQLLIIRSTKMYLFLLKRFMQENKKSSSSIIGCRQVQYDMIKHQL